MNIKSVFRLLKPYSRMIAAIIVYAVLISILAAVIPFINQRMLDEVNELSVEMKKTIPREK